MTTETASTYCPTCLRDYVPYVTPNRCAIEIPDDFAIARWRRDADVATIARCILGTLKYEPHGCDVTPLREALEHVIRDYLKSSLGDWKMGAEQLTTATA